MDCSDENRHRRLFVMSMMMIAKLLSIICRSDGP